MGRSQRAKGAAGERELAAVVHMHLQDVLAERPQRNLEQTRGGGHDLTGLPYIAVECKRHEQLAVDAWWRQACEQAEAAGAHPVLAYRQSRKPWTFVLPWDLLSPDFADAPGYFCTDIEGFAWVYRRLYNALEAL